MLTYVKQFKRLLLPLPDPEIQVHVSLGWATNGSVTEPQGSTGVQSQRALETVLNLGLIPHRAVHRQRLEHRISIVNQQDVMIVVVVLFRALWSTS